ncbi:type I-U CRISPR-associated protein Cas7 [Corynebacterium sp.]|uniref:type I-G CRISPR-associated protein Cas7 n=1 Tax=Corynebacterium sp. TaxID=1720 RepID=UPI003B3BCFCD
MSTSIPTLPVDISAIRYTGDLVPIAGQGTPVAPPTYIAPSGAASPQFAKAELHPVPDLSNTDEEPDSFLTDDHGAPVLRPAVVLNSLGAEATLFENAILAGQNELLGDRNGGQLPGIYLNADDFSNSDLIAIATTALKSQTSQYTPESLAEALRADLDQAQASTWTSPHRFADTYIRHAVIDGEQIWASPKSKTYKLIAQASQNRADLLFRYFPNAALLGFWLASAAPRRNKLARSLSSTVIGYDAHPISYGATKGDPLGGITKGFSVRRNPKTLELERPTGNGKGAPSNVGMGLVPNSPEDRAFSCSTILRRASISLTHLRHLSVPGGSPEVSRQIADVLAWMGIYGILSTSTDGFFRSGCDLVTRADHTTISFVHRDGATELREITIDDAVAGFQHAYDQLPDEYRFAPPIHASYPKVALEARAATLVKESQPSDEG